MYRDDSGIFNLVIKGIPHVSCFLIKILGKKV